MKKVLVIGSLNMDMTMKVENLPKLGETILGYDFYESCGGKGANQAVALAKLGMDVEMLGMVGCDSQGDKLIANLEKYNIKNDNILKSDKNVTGKAIITIDKNGDNNIVVIPGSNFEITKEDIQKNISVIENADILVLQNEIPKDVVEYILSEAKRLNKLTVYNPAPARNISESMAKNTDFLILNETETFEIFGIKVDKEDKDSLERINRYREEKGYSYLIITLGEYGSVVFSKCGKVKEYDAVKVKAIDSTAAGDSFLGAFIAKYSQSEDIEEAIKYASIVSAIVVTRKGAQDSIPTKKEIEEYITGGKQC